MNLTKHRDHGDPITAPRQRIVGAPTSYTIIYIYGAAPLEIFKSSAIVSSSR